MAMDIASICEIPVVPEVHPAVLRRHSTMAFDTDAEISDSALDTILDAAPSLPHSATRSAERPSWGVAPGMVAGVSRERRSRDDVTWARTRGAARR